jgi:CO/xanthine dehydrogenase FAD-binding subunit
MLHDSPTGSVTWLHPSTRDEAFSHVVGGGTPVAGGAALLSLALAPALGERAVDVAALLPSGVKDGVIGASTTLAQLAADPHANTYWPAIAEAAAMTATPQIRNVATVGGTLAARLPTSDLAASLAAHDCVVHVLTVDGEQDLEVLDYLSRPKLPTHLVLGVQPRASGPGAHRRFALRTGPAPALATVAGVRVDGGLRLFAGAVGHTSSPVSVDGDLGVGSLRSDARASASYRLQLIRVLADDVRRTLGAPE